MNSMVTRRNVFALIPLCVVVKERGGNRPGLRRGCRPEKTASAPRPPELVGVTGFEPVTLRLSSACSNQLSYTPIADRLRNLRFQISNLKPQLVELRRVELPTPCLQSRCSTTELQPHHGLRHIWSFELCSRLAKSKLPLKTELCDKLSLSSLAGRRPRKSGCDPDPWFSLERR